ncbi:MAG: glycosyltransferase [Acinetobacter ursingii]|nr:glycosyltransferase [Acinetobacter ursingii]
MSKKYFLTIIIAAYNIENYIDECLNSLGFKNISVEIIVINDFSNDLTKVILDKYSDIKIINLKKNIGISEVRNLGIKIAKGEYITFIDGDDYIKSEILEEFLLNYKLKPNVDVLIGNYINFYENKNLYLANKVQNEIFGDFFVGEEVVEKYLLNTVSGSVWKGIYKLSFLQKASIRFMKDVTIAEDLEWLIRVLLLANKVVIDTSKTYYVYRTRENSVMNSNFSKKKYEDSLKVTLSLLDLEKNNKNLNSTCRQKMHIISLAVFLQAIGCYSAIQDYKNIKKISKMIYTGSVFYSSILFGLRLMPKIIIKLLRFKYS